MQNPKALFPMFLTKNLEATKRFYTETLDFKLVVDMASYLQVESKEPGAPTLCFMKPDSFPDGKTRPAFNGKGVIVSIPTESADKKYAALTQHGAELLSPPEDKPWGWRSFFAVDPNGVVLDFFHVYKEVDLSTL